ncbi:sugar transferase [Pseudobutyrivibrio sp.]|uniref:sugar transferase n=1 Tax=Pseudobutyrivibrio sp. TaxID=2014367 RepID=UPI001DDC65EA|nr:sugar transferase [Pseudobutyrivibrio sp.]MBE5910041.1 sugar transferase [Pseudobutyrivibrio sp.]
MNSLYRRVIKRILDLIIGVILLFLLGWLIIVLSIVIVLAEGRPVFFKQKRVGQYGRPFNIYKFRTMVKNAEKIGPKQTNREDSRITKVGKLLRKTSLDELPQIVNLIKGDMSVVGYRPGVYENYTENDFKSGMFDVKPGITGYAQVNGRSSLSLEEKRMWELKYVKDISFCVDLLIILKTIKVVISRSNSY